MITPHGGSARDLLLTDARLVGSSGEPVDVLVREGRIAAIGPRLAASGRTAGVDRIAMDGRTVLRGLRDAHVHMTQWALTRRRLDLSSARSVADAVALVVQRLAAEPLGDGPLAAERLAAEPLGDGPDRSPVLVGMGFRDGLWPDGPTAARLDEGLRAAGHGSAPVFLLSGDLHSAWLSTPALRRLGRGDHPTGLLREDEWMPLMNRLEHVPAQRGDAFVDEAARAAAARGVTELVDLEIDDNLRSWRRRVAAGTDVLRVAVGVWPDHLDGAIARGLSTGDVVPGTGGLVTMGPLKVITDGSLNTRTAFCHDPYPGLDGTGEARGRLVVAGEDLARLMATAHRHGIASAIHAIGDAANTLVLDAFEATGARGSVEHAQLLRDGDAERFARLGVVAGVQPEHAMDDRDVADRYWPGRTGRAFAVGTLLRAGATLAFGSDAPVAPLDPWRGVAAAVHRSRDGREPWHPEQRIGVADALDASTGGRATPRVGDRADLAVVDIDPVVADAATLRAMPVSGTLLAGRWTWCTLDR
ncbi:amidohydrolase [uncultured Cellulomonas sp.]|uniref:amidohydrolase n=1 Tax=uncultured Cellulomonas sp. TaxID=189682 RepID=UPI0026373123|nr:amidohydrolase family protein [uncultured Cellulomonas sp.]